MTDMKDKIFKKLQQGAREALAIKMRLSRLYFFFWRWRYPANRYVLIRVKGWRTFLIDDKQRIERVTTTPIFWFERKWD